MFEGHLIILFMTCIKPERQELSDDYNLLTCNSRYLQLINLSPVIGPVSLSYGNLHRPPPAPPDLFDYCREKIPLRILSFSVARLAETMSC